MLARIMETFGTSPVGLEPTKNEFEELERYEKHGLTHIRPSRRARQICNVHSRRRSRHDRRREKACIRLDREIHITDQPRKGEWKSVKNAKENSAEKRERYETCKQRKPLWGYQNEADPEVMKMQFYTMLANHDANHAWKIDLSDELSSPPTR